MGPNVSLSMRVLIDLMAGLLFERLFGEDLFFEELAMAARTTGDRRHGREALGHCPGSCPSISCGSGRAARPRRRRLACRRRRPSPGWDRDWPGSAPPPRWAPRPCAPPVAARRRALRPQDRSRLRLHRPPRRRSPRIAGRTEPMDRRSPSRRQTARSGVPECRRRTRRPRSLRRSLSDPRTDAAGRRSFPRDTAPACAATGARRPRGCRRKYRNDAPRAGRSWRRRRALCARPRAGPPGPGYRSGCDRRPWGDPFCLERAPGPGRTAPDLRHGLTGRMLSVAGLTFLALPRDVGLRDQARPQARNLASLIWKWRLLLPGASEPRL